MCGICGYITKQNIAPVVLTALNDTISHRGHYEGSTYQVTVDLSMLSLGQVSAPIQPGDVVATHADTISLTNETGFLPSILIEIGIPRFVEWYLDYYGQKH